MLSKNAGGPKGCGHLQDLGGVPTERAPKAMGTDVENHLIHALDEKLSMFKGGPGSRSGGSLLGQSGAPCLPGGKCFAPWDELLGLDPFNGLCNHR